MARLGFDLDGRDPGSVLLNINTYYLSFCCKANESIPKSTGGHEETAFENTSLWDAQSGEDAVTAGSLCVSGQSD